MSLVGLGSVSDYATHHLHVPVMVVRPPAAPGKGAATPAPPAPRPGGKVRRAPPPPPPPLPP
jgi:hypothetical protein